MQRVRLLAIGDMQNGFTREDGNLAIPGAEEILGLTNDFLRRVDGFFDYTLIVQDTHFAEEYGRSEESRTFPLHCEYGTADWELSVDVSGLPNKHYLTKNQYDMWSRSGLHEISFDDPKRKIAYENLFHVVDDPHEPRARTTRDGFLAMLQQAGSGAAIDVTLIGVAADYCNRYAMEGWLARGARVTILQDLTKGIEKETPQVLAEERYRDYTPGRLRAVDSAEYAWE
ncbi:isochorismatase family protein [Methanoculleus sp. FWC-SCC1]|uniref:nicotinamidase n=1 Tax=Methanoculleus frigidifontis TaxID=2584085 RepID=A0ABT8MCW6_9EURY|nr:isochorismatase family protein [Methanoculleus sp. FWC-SCC1]MDN7025783.1 isochorismatase family protein [Methanoculleus sp. FWC-SCC1]